MSVLSDAGVFGPLSVSQAPTTNANAANIPGSAALSLSGAGGANGTAIVALAAMALLAIVYWRTHGIEH